MSPLDMCFMASVVFAAWKVIQLWIAWELNRDCYKEKED